MKKKILVLNWKCIRHPQAGGAEIVTHEILKRFIEDGHEVTMIVAQPLNYKHEEIIDGIKIIRVGGRLSHYWQTYRYYKKNYLEKFSDIDLIIEEVNTLPYFSKLYTKAGKNFLFFHQLAREVWWYQMAQPLSSLGFVLEPFYLWFLSKISPQVITISQSTKNDLMKYGFKNKSIQIIREGIMNASLETIDFSKKEKKFTVLFHSALREMKRPDHAVEAFCMFWGKLSKEEQKVTQMWVSGGGPLKDQCEKIIKKYNAENFATLFGRTTDEQMYDLMKRASVLVATSVKEGWGLIVTESNSFGTPAISYDVDGLRDSTALGGGKISKPTVESMAEKIFEMYEVFINDTEIFEQMCSAALESSRDITFDNCYSDFKKIISK